MSSLVKYLWQVLGSYLNTGFLRKMPGSELNFDLVFLRLGFSEMVEM